MIATGNHFNFDSLRGAPPLVSKGSLWVLLHRRICLFQQYFYAGKHSPSDSQGGSEGVFGRKGMPLKKTACFLRGLPPTPVRLRGRRRRKLRPGFAGKGTPFLQYPDRPAGDSGGFWIFGRYPNWAFRDSGHFCPRKIPLRPLLLFETGRIQTATVAQLGQE